VDSNFHRGNSKLVEYEGFDFCRMIPIDSMHCIYLGMKCTSIFKIHCMTPQFESMLIDGLMCVQFIITGVFKKLLIHWLDATQYKNGIIFHPSALLAINQHICDTIKKKKYCPSEFARKPRWLRDACRYKATEYRQLLLYTGVVVFLKKLPQAHNKIFLLLVTSI